MLVELGLMEQRHKAVLEVLGGLPVVEVARRYGVARQTVHEWMRRYATFGFAGLFDRSCRPATCPHQMRPEVEARIVALRRAHSGWGPHMLRYQLEKEQLDFVPSPFSCPSPLKWGWQGIDGQQSGLGDMRHLWGSCGTSFCDRR